MKTKNVIGVILMIMGVGVGLYCGLYWAFILGIVNVIEQIRAPQMDAMIIALNIVRILFAALIGWISFGVVFLTGYFLAIK